MLGSRLLTITKAKKTAAISPRHGARWDADRHHCVALLRLRTECAQIKRARKMETTIAKRPNAIAELAAYWAMSSLFPLRFLARYAPQMAPAKAPKIVIIIRCPF